MPDPTPPARGLYRHYKGGLYRLVEVTEVVEVGGQNYRIEGGPAVCYESVETGERWLRPLSEWQSSVPNDGYDYGLVGGSKPMWQPRYARVEEQSNV